MYAQIADRVSAIVPVPTCIFSVHIAPATAGKAWHTSNGRSRRYRELEMSVLYNVGLKLV